MVWPLIWLFIATFFLDRKSDEEYFGSANFDSAINGLGARKEETSNFL
jgi:hypothetical protein